MGVVYPLGIGAELSKERFRLRGIEKMAFGGLAPIPSKPDREMELRCVHLFRFRKLRNQLYFPSIPSFLLSPQGQFRQAQL